MKKFYYTFFILISFIYSSAQEITVNLKNANKNYNYLEVYSYYPSTEPIYKNELKSDSIFFKLSPSKTSLYTLYIVDSLGRKKNQDFIIEKDQKLNFTWDTEKNETQFEKNSINYIYQTKLKNLSNSYKKIYTSKTFIDQYPEKDKLYQEVITHKIKIEKEFEELITSYSTGEKFINLLFNGIKLNNSSLKDYFKDLPLNNSEWYQTPRPRELLNGYIKLLKEENSKLSNEEFSNLLVNNLITIFGVNKNGLTFLKDFALVNWNNYENELTLKLISDQLIKNNTDFISDKKLVDINKFYGKYTVNKIFPLNELTTKEITKKEVLVIFMSTSCGYCDKIFEQLKKFSNELKESEIFIVSTESKNSINQKKMEEWKNEKSIKLNFIQSENIYQKKNEFAMFGTPTNYFLEKDANNNWIIKFKRGYKEF